MGGEINILKSISGPIQHHITDDHIFTAEFIMCLGKVGKKMKKRQLCFSPLLTISYALQ